jgi:hypothetical protein
MDEKEAEDLTHAIDRRRRLLNETATRLHPQPNTTTTTTTNGQQRHVLLSTIFDQEKELTKLYNDYEQLTGEVYEEDADDSQTVIHNMDHAPPSLSLLLSEKKKKKDGKKTS